MLRFYFVFKWLLCRKCPKNRYECQNNWFQPLKDSSENKALHPNFIFFFTCLVQYFTVLFYYVYIKAILKMFLVLYLYHGGHFLEWSTSLALFKWENCDPSTVTKYFRIHTYFKNSFFFLLSFLLLSFFFFLLSLYTAAIKQ